MSRQTQVEQYLKNLYRVYQYRLATQQNHPEIAQIHQPEQTGTSLTARQIALSIMNNPQPHAFTPATVETHDDSNPILNLGREILDSGPVKAALDIISRPSYAVGGTFEALAGGKNPTATRSLGELGNRLSNIPGKAWEGLTGKEHTTVSEVMNRDTEYQKLPGPVKFTEGLVADIATDPTTYIPGGLVAQAGKRVLGITKGAEKATKVASTATNIADDAAAAKIGETVQSVATEANKSDPLQEALSKVPVAAHPSIDAITSPFKEVVKETPVATPDSPSLAARRAIKAALLQSDTHMIQGKWKVGDLLRVAKENPEKQASIDKILNAETNRIYTSKDFGPLYRGKKAATAIHFLNDKGGVIGGLNLKQLHQLFKEGKIGTGEVGDEAMSLPIHDPEDLKSFLLKNAKGETVSLHQYLEDLGVGVKAGDKEIIKPRGKTITERTTVAPTTADSIAWATEHVGKLSQKELTTLAKASSPEEFSKLVNDLKAKTVVKAFNTPKEFAEAVKTGIVPKESAEAIYKTIGAKNLDDFVSKTEKITKETGKGPADRIVERLSDADPEALKAANADWETPAQLVEKAATGDVSAIAKTVPSITPQIIEDLSKALPHAIVENLIDPQDLAKYPFITDIKKAKRTAKTPFEGRARNLHGWHGISQTDVFRVLARQSAARHAQTGLRGKEFISYARMRADMMYNDILPALRVAEAALKDQGVKFIAGNQETGIMFSLVDALDSLGPDLTKKWLFGIGHNRPQALPTAIMDSMEVLVRQRLSGGNLAVAKLAATKILENSPRMTGNSAERLVNQMLDRMSNAMRRVSANYAEESIKMGESVKSMTDDTIHNVVTKFADPNVSMGEALGEISQRVNFASAIGKKMDAPEGAISVAKAIVDSELVNKGIEAQDLVEADTARKLENADAAAVKKTGVDQQASRATSGLSGADDFIHDLSDTMDVRLQAGVFRANVPVLNKLIAIKDGLGRSFVASYGNDQLHYMVHVNRNVTQSFARMHRGIMQKTYELARKNFGAQANERLAEAFKHLQAGTPIDEPAMAELMDQMKQSLDILFQGTGEGHGAFAARNGLFAPHLNEVMRKYGVKGLEFDETVPLTKQTQSWRKWDDVSDPLDTLDKIHAAFQRATIDVTIGRDFADTAHEWVSSTAKPGFVKIADSKGKSTIFRFIDDSKFYDKNVVEQLPYLENVLNGSFLHHDRAGILSLYDSVLHAWKAGVTIYRPGHHVRNLIGDVGLSFLAGVYNPGAYKTAARILAGRASAYKEWDAFAALQAGFKSPVTPGKTKLGVVIGGKRVAINDDQLWRAAFKQGILPDYSVLEDIAFNASQGSTKLGGVSLRKPFGGRVQQAAGGLSQARDHWVRMAHFVDVLQKGKYKTFEEAAQRAGAVVRKWHPDGSDLTSFERQVMRRVIPFYSWFRKAIPLVVEALVMQPGRALVVPKAMQNFAQQMGVDTESLGNPFPMDQLFPDWLQDNTLGPQWRGNLGIPGLGQYEDRYYGVNPGDPVTDLGNSFLGASPVNSILGGLTPVAKIPLELGTGTILGTGSNITDTSDYLDSQIPGVSQLANVTNTSVTGGDPQYDVQKGRSAPGMDQLAMANFLTGLGIKDYSKPNYIKSAQLELRDKLRGR